MKNLVLAASAILPLLAGGAADAADMPAKAAMYKAPPPVAYNWTGLYFGGHVGSAWATDEWRGINFLTFGTFQLGTGNGSGFLGGAQVGVNYQVDAVVLGVEADVSWAALSGDACNTIQAAVHCFFRVDRFGTIAGRFGIAADRVLVYLKGGAAWLHDTEVLSILQDSSTSGSKWGWTAGAGVEYALTRNWSAKLEYDFLDFGTSRFTFFDTLLITVDVKQNIQTAKFGLNYKFDWGAPAAGSY